MADSAFAPKTHPEYFSVAGCQWLLHLGDDETKRRFTIGIKNAPKNWKLHSSIGKRPEKMTINGSYYDILATRIGGGGNSHHFVVKGKPVSIFVKGKFDIPRSEIFSAAEKIVRVQRDWFRDYDQPFYHVVINERKGVVAGTSIENQFVCFVRSGVGKIALNKILAHEMFHSWLPNKMRIKRGKNIHQVRYEWFFEGFTEYFAKKVLFDAGLLTPMEFADQINKDIHSLADSPHKSIRYTEFSKLAKARKFTSAHKKLSYYRGVLIALKWESILNSKPRRDSLSSFLQRLYREFRINGGELTEDEFYTFSKRSGVDGAGDFEKYIVNGKPIESSSKFARKETFYSNQNRFGSSHPASQLENQGARKE